MNDYGVLTAPDTLRIERLLPGPIERVWQYLTDSDKRATWLAEGSVEQKIGGKVEHTFRNSELSPEHDIPPPKYSNCAGDVPMLGKVTACEPLRLLSYLWNAGSEGESEVSFELAHQDQVKLRKGSGRCIRVWSRNMPNVWLGKYHVTIFYVTYKVA